MSQGESRQRMGSNQIANVSMEDLYVSSVVQELSKQRRDPKLAHSSLWKSLHGAVLRLRGAKGALKATADLNLLNFDEHSMLEVQEVLSSLELECRNFAEWRSLATAQQSQESENDSKKNESVFRVTEPSNLSPQNRENFVEARGVSVRSRFRWGPRERDQVASKLLSVLHSLGALSRQAGDLSKAQMQNFFRDHVLLMIEPCSQYFLESRDIVKLVIDMLTVHDQVSMKDRKMLREWRESDVLASRFRRCLNRWSRTNAKKSYGLPALRKLQKLTSCPTASYRVRFRSSAELVPKTSNHPGKANSNSLSELAESITSRVYTSAQTIKPSIARESLPFVSAIVR